MLTAILITLAILAAICASFILWLCWKASRADELCQHSTDCDFDNGGDNE